MKTKSALTALIAGGFAAAILATATPAMAHRFDRQTYHPMRIVAYVVHPIGIAAEYLIARPIHYVVSQPDLDIVFGHQPMIMDDGTYFEWVHGDFRPSIKEERRERARADRALAR